MNCQGGTRRLAAAAGSSSGTTAGRPSPLTRPAFSSAPSTTSPLHSQPRLTHKRPSLNAFGSSSSSSSSPTAAAARGPLPAAAAVMVGASSSSSNPQAVALQQAAPQPGVAGGKAVPTFQEAIARLQDFWASVGCVVSLLISNRSVVIIRIMMTIILTIVIIIIP